MFCASRFVFSVAAMLSRRGSLLLVAGCLLANICSARPLMWQVEKPGVSGEVYLFGSLHYGLPDFYPLPDYVMQAYEAADALVVELDVDTLEQTDVAQLMTGLGYWPPANKANQQPLKNLIGKKQWNLLADKAADQGVDAERFKNTRPWLVSMQLVSGQLRQTRFAATQGIDRYFIGLAREQKPILQLETFEQQIRTFSDISEAHQVALLASTLKDYEKAPEMLEKLATSWQQGNVDQLEKHIFTAFHGSDVGEVLYERVFTGRNEQMAAYIANKLAAPQRYFVVTGIGHMLGDDGLVCLLQRDGYRIQQYPPTEAPLCPDV